ncbi:hypothetical protein VTL71DRAFT_6038 [Oculimacula yallundae]|uniref:Uncharacterized protein n=1 Tax=Oculimacula yallundae TaxID=86028 RepID=A0ABR4BZ80_9HELO
MGDQVRNTFKAWIYSKGDSLQKGSQKYLIRRLLGEAYKQALLEISQKLRLNISTLLVSAATLFLPKPSLHLQPPLVTHHTQAVPCYISTFFGNTADSANDINP